MNLVICLFIFVLFCREQVVVKGAYHSLKAINNSAHATKLFFQVRNSEAPSKNDPAFASRRIRKRICQEITHSGFFNEDNLQPVVMNEVLGQLMVQNPAIFHQIYIPRTTVNVVKRSKRPFKYNNAFKPIEFLLDAFPAGGVNFIHVKEHVIVCVLKYQRSDKLVPRYVTKEYNVFGDPHMLQDPYKAGRFIIERLEDFDLYNARVMFQSISLAEEPASTDKKFDSSVKLELRYLQIRKHREPAVNDDLDPFCRLLRGRPYWNNQHTRFCVAILKSPDFVHKFISPLRQVIVREPGCKKVKVSFQTLEAKQLAFGQKYSERMVRCPALCLESAEPVSLYISRAYIAERLFVFRRWGDGKVYLENLSANIAVVDVPSHPFEDVED